MKICFANTLENTGGAAIAARRVFEEVHSHYPRSRYLVSQKSSRLEQVLAAYSRFSRLAPRLRKRLEKDYTRLYGRGSRGVFSSARFRAATVIRKINSLDPDIVHLHWINSGFLAIEDLQHIEAPLVWTLHDMWPFTGGCHYADGCQHWLGCCGDCPKLTGGGSHDLSWKIFSRKSAAWPELDLTIVTPSRWLADLAGKSPLLGRFQIHVIPNGLDTALYCPQDKAAARRSLGLPQDKSLALFGAMYATTDHRKGFDLLIDSLSHIPASLRKHLDLAVFGNQDNELEKFLDFKIHFLGKIEDEGKLAELYSAADLFISPSREDNLPNTCIEAMACGTPVVAFDIGGMPDIIQHRKTGFLANAFDTEEMARGICWLVESLTGSNDIPLATRSHAEKNYNQVINARRYMELYKRILDTQDQLPGHSTGIEFPAGD